MGLHALIGRARFHDAAAGDVHHRAAVPGVRIHDDEGRACLQSTGTGSPDQRVAVWENNRAYYELCYSDTVPLYTAEMLNLVSSRTSSSWTEVDGTGMARTQYDGTPAIRYMEYPVLTGLYQYGRWLWPKTYTALTKLRSIPVTAEVVMSSTSRRWGWRWRGWPRVGATAKMAGRRIWDAAVVAGSPLLIFHAFTNFDDALAAACAAGAIAGVGPSKTCDGGRAHRHRRSR